MKKVITLIITTIMLTSCSPKNEALDLYTRIRNFFIDDNKVISDQIENEDNNTLNQGSNDLISIEENNDNTVTINVSDTESQDTNLNLNQDTYDKYEGLISYAEAYISENNVDISRLQTDNAYFMKHAFKFSRLYGIDLNSLSNEDIAELEKVFNQ